MASMRAASSRVCCVVNGNGGYGMLEAFAQCSECVLTGELMFTAPMTGNVVMEATMPVSGQRPSAGNRP